MHHPLVPSRFAGAGLLAGVLAFSAGDLLRRVVEPTDASSAAAITASVDAQTGLWLAAGLLELASAALLLVGALSARRLASARGARLTAIGGGLLVAGAVASVGHTIGYFGTYAGYADSGLDASTLNGLSQANDVLGGVAIAVFMLGMLLGPVLLTIGLRRAGVVPIWVPVAAVVFVVAGAVSGVAAGVVGLLAGLASLGVVGATMLRAAASRPSAATGADPAAALA
ncbi:hypothetical protein [Angustibacter sp. Root456]|uniref:hypothetical protein n=1 Tax=Angustibacter sp. Root456 TaxID=1736539 RepID=UPI0006F20FD0|nr:hypothetical protein [Angustibacter sp. Root456]KQX67046.1 hypothetical protein ASD06_18130 [Angustibacter sp. Root456]